MGNICCNNNPKLNLNEIIKLKDHLYKIEDNSKFEETKNILGTTLKITFFEGDKNDITKRIFPERIEDYNFNKEGNIISIFSKNN